MAPPLPLLNQETADLLLVALLFLLLSPVFPLALYCTGKCRRNSELRKRFYEAAWERGLTSSQGRLLLRLARRNGLDHPGLLLSSLEVFDRCIGGWAARLVKRDPAANAEIFKELSRLRTALGFDEPVPGRPARTTRQLRCGQHLAIRADKAAPAPGATCVVVARDERAIVAAFLDREEHRGLKAWKPGGKVAVQFQPEKGKEYRFCTEILEVVSRTRSLVLRHSESVARIQAREFFRWDTSFAVVFLARQDSQKLEVRVTDISGGGLGVLSAGPVLPGELVSVDPAYKGPFPLAGAVCEVVAVNQKGQLWSLHLKFVDLPGKQESGIIRTIYQHQRGMKGSDLVAQRPSRKQRQAASPWPVRAAAG